MKFEIFKCTLNFDILGTFRLIWRLFSKKATYQVLDEKKYKTKISKYYINIIKRKLVKLEPYIVIMLFYEVYLEVIFFFKDIEPKNISSVHYFL